MFPERSEHVVAWVFQSYNEGLSLALASWCQIRSGMAPLRTSSRFNNCEESLETLLSGVALSEERTKKLDETHGFQCQSLSCGVVYTQLWRLWGGCCPC